MVSATSPSLVAVVPAGGALPLVVVVIASVVTAVAVHRAVVAGRAAAVLVRLEPDHDRPGPPAWFGQVLEEAGLELEAERAWTAAIACAAVAALLIAWRWPQIVLAAAAIAMVVVTARRRSRERQAHRTYDATLVTVIDRLVARLTTGTSLAVALEDGSSHRSPVGLDIAEVVRRHVHGQPLQGAIDRWATTRDTDGVRLLADALAIAGRSGGSQRAALLGVQATLRSRESLAREVRALASQARTSGIVLAVTPAAFAAVVAMVDPGVAAFFSTPAGWGCLLVGVLLDGVGALWMNRLTEAHS